MDQLPFNFFPERRLYMDFPWQIWAIGWLAIFKAILWAFTDQILPETVLKLLFYKYILFMFPFVICGMGVWNLRKWAASGILILCCTELVFFIIYPSLLTSFALDTSSLLSLIFTAIQSVIQSVIQGPISVIFILIYTPLLFKHTGC